MSDLHPVGVFDDVEIMDHGIDRVGEKESLRFWAKFQTEHGNVYGNFWLTEKAIKHSIEKILIMWGADAPASEEIKLAMLDDGEAMAGNVVQVTVEHDTYDGKTRAQVGFVNKNKAVGGPTRDEDAAASTSAFDSLLRKAKRDIEESDVPF